MRRPSRALTFPGVPLFAQQLCVDDLLDLPPLPGRYDDERGLRVDAAGIPIAAALGMPTRAHSHRPGAGLLPTGTKAMSDRDDSPASEGGLMLTTKTSAGRDSDDDWALFATITRGPPDRDD
jgi:hypothetical protein